jgi:hypothetical protein
LFVFCTFRGCDAEGEPCKNQCTNKGRYCASDPEKNIDVGFEGRDVVSENLRQLCLFKLLNETSQPLEYWRYMEHFYSDEPGKGCPGEKDWETSVCSYRVIDSLNFKSVPSSAVQKCIEDSGNYLPSTDGPNKLLDEEIERQAIKGIFVLPQAFVNDQPYYGSLSCPAPIGIDRCGLLKQICSAYEETLQPKICTLPVGCNLGIEKKVCKCPDCKQFSNQTTTTTSKTIKESVPNKTLFKIIKSNRQMRQSFIWTEEEKERQTEE